MATNFPTSVDVLTNPVSNDSLNSPSHSAQHANANDAIEAIESFVLGQTGNAWTPYTPLLGGGWANGNGTWTANYTQIGKTVHVAGFFVLGSTTTKGTVMTISYPVIAKTAGQQTNGNVYAILGSTTFPLVMLNSSTGNCQIGTSVANATYTTFNVVTATTPATWATNDVIYFGLTYEAA
jgi:hypothetical protein